VDAERRWLEVSVVSDDVPISAEATIAYARATNDTNARHLSGELAPPLFAVVPSLKTLVRPKRTATSLHSLHGEHDLVLHRPIVPGMTLRTHARLAGVHPSPAGVVMVGRGETRTVEGDLVNEQYLTWVFRGQTLAASMGEHAPDHRLPAGIRDTPPVARVVSPLDADQTRRYGEASGDRDAYTFDDAYARSLGYPGAIVHGLCTMAFAGRAVVDRCCAGDSRRLARLAVRFSGLLLMTPGQEVTTVIWAAGRRGDREAFAFEAEDVKSQTVITHGLAEVHP
jgi:acyl dehydratase